jgi:hypothetical protein
VRRFWLRFLIAMRVETAQVDLEHLGQKIPRLRDLARVLEIVRLKPSPAMKVLAARAHDELAGSMLRVCTLREQPVLLVNLEGHATIARFKDIVYPGRLIVRAAPSPNVITWDLRIDTEAETDVGTSPGFAADDP